MEADRGGVASSIFSGLARLGQALRGSVADDRVEDDVTPPLPETLGEPTKPGGDLYQALVDIAMGSDMILPHDLELIRALVRGVLENGEPLGRDVAVLDYHDRLVRAAEANDHRLEAAW